MKTSSPSVINIIVVLIQQLSQLGKGDLMYLPEEKRAEIRECIGNSKVNSGLNSIEDKITNIKGFQDTEGSSKVSQILFDARDGKEVFTPF